MYYVTWFDRSCGARVVSMWDVDEVWLTDQHGARREASKKYHGQVHPWPSGLQVRPRVQADYYVGLLPPDTALELYDSEQDWADTTKEED